MLVMKKIIWILLGLLIVCIIGVRMHPCEYLYNKKIWTSPDGRISISYYLPKWWTGIFLYPLNQEPCWIKIYDNEYKEIVLKFRWIEPMLHLSNIIWCEEFLEYDLNHSTSITGQSYKCAYPPYFLIRYEKGEQIHDL